MRGPFEPAVRAEPAVTHGSAVAATSLAASPPAVDASPGGGASSAVAGTSMSQDARASVWSPGAAKMDQIKDLYLTAEAIGEDALDKHFELVSDRQRQLIREYFRGAVASQADSQDRG